MQLELSFITMSNYFSYGKTKDAFGWPEENEELSNNVSAPVAQTSSAASENESMPVTPTPLTSLEKYVLMKNQFLPLPILIYNYNIY